MTRFHITSIALLLLLAACSGGNVKEMLGIDSRAPDEFRVVSRPPLSVPPQFNLMPPAIPDGSANPYAADKQAESLVTGKPADAANGSETFVLKNVGTDTVVTPVEARTVNNTTGSSAEAQFLQNAGADNADPTVRRALVEEKITKQEEQDDRSWWDWMTFRPEKKEAVVDATKEAERIQKNQQEGKPANDGETATVKPKDRGVLGYILGD